MVDLESAMASEETAVKEEMEVEQTPQSKKDGQDDGEEQPKEPDFCLESIHTTLALVHCSLTAS